MKQILSDKQLSDLIKKAFGFSLDLGYDTKIVIKVLEDIRKNITVDWCKANIILKESGFKPEKLMLL